MSTVYIQEPPTYGKVLLKTTVGDIDIELWSKEAPLACKNFVQLCMERYYDNTIFHRVVKGFIAQGGDPSGSGEGGESVFGEPFKDEFHSRLRFNKRGLVAMANAGKNDNGSQFFFTLGATPELQNKHTIFAKVGGNTIYNMIKLEEGEILDEDRPLYPQKILSTHILLNPFTDIVPRADRMPKDLEIKPQKKKEIRGVKDFKLLSFGEEAEEEEENLMEVIKEYSNKSKAVPGLVEEPLPSEPLEEPVLPEQDEESKISALDYVKQKLAKKTDGKEEKTEEKVEPNEEPDKPPEKEPSPSSEKPKKRKKDKNDDESQKEEEPPKRVINEEYLALTNMYAHLKRPKKAPKGPKVKGAEDLAFKKLKEFQEKIRRIQSSETPDEEDTEGLFTHKLTAAADKKPVLAKDANMPSDDWYDITDPRNAINKRKRKELPESFK